MNTRLVAIGGLQVDNVVTPSGEVGLSFAGGNGIYSAVGAYLWARHCQLIGQVAQTFPLTWLEQLQGAGVDTHGVTEITGFKPTASEWFFYAADGSRSDLIFAAPSDLVPYGIHLPPGLDVTLHLKPEQLQKLIAAVETVSVGRAEPRPVFDVEIRAQEINVIVPTGAAVHIAPNSLEMHQALTKNIVEKAQVISLDPGHYIKNLQPEQLIEILKHVTIFAPSEREVYEFRGPCDLYKAANDFAQMGPKIVVIKIGMQGSLVFERDTGKFVQIPAFPTKTLDPTGCGDAFCGGFLAGFVETGDAVEASLCGTVAASFTVEGFGATYGLRFTRANTDERRGWLRNRAVTVS